MDKTSNAHSQRQISAAVDSDDDLGIYDYQQSRQNDRPPRRSAPKETDRQHSKTQHHYRADKQHGDTSSSDDYAAEPVNEADNETEDDDSDADEGESKHPFYSYATERSDVHADAKLIYQRHRLDARSESESGGSPYLLARSFTMPPSAAYDGDANLGRSPSMSSRRSRPGQRGITPSLGQPAMRMSQSREAFPTLHDLAASADTQIHGQSNRPGIPLELVDPLLSNQGVYGAGAGVGVGTGPDGFAKSEGAIVSEVEAICDKIKHILDLRQGYMEVSNQRSGDNPKDHDAWKVYPAPPEPVWNEEKRRLERQREEENVSAASSLYVSDPKSVEKDGNKFFAHGDNAPPSPTAAKKRRKAGTDIGEDFDFKECYIPGKSAKSLTYALDQGSVYQVLDSEGKPLVSVPTLRDYYKALDEVLDIASDGPSKSFAYRRLEYLQGRFDLYKLLNEYEEVAETKKVPHRDFYNVRKVDTHVHHSACMNQKHLLRFIKSKMKRCPDELVIDRDGKQLTLSQVFESINLTAYDLSIDTLDMHAHTDSFHRFDKFNLKYNPIGQSRLRDIFLKTDNFIKGRYLAEITKEVISDLESSKYQMVEWRISVYGRNIHEWDTLAKWVVDNKLFSPNVRWLIQIPRLYSLYKSMNTMENYEQLIRNIWQPLFEVTEDPSSHPELHVFLQRVIGFDCVDDESKVEKRLFRKYPAPKDWSTKQNPPYGYWIYYLFANMTSLNAWRKQRGFNTFLLRPHCGEAGDIDHLAAAVLCCHSISHGITLRKVPLLQYVFYLEQIGVAMSPLSNNALFLTYDRNPFISYFKKGLNVSLSTDDPLQFAFTKEPLIEEYSVAAQIYKLSSVDMCELAKHSVDQCGFELQLKRRWLGDGCALPGIYGNDVSKCNVPNIREAFRHETLRAEHAFIARYTQDFSHLERHTPVVPDLSNPAAPASDAQKAYDSSRHYHSAVADSIPQAQLARRPGSSTAFGIGLYTDKNGELETMIRSGRHQLQQQQQQPSSANATGQHGVSSYSYHTDRHAGHLATSPTQVQTPFQRHRAGSRSSVLSRASYSDALPTTNDPHISGQEPRAFPGLVAERHKRSSSIKAGHVPDLNMGVGVGIGMVTRVKSGESHYGGGGGGSASVGDEATSLDDSLVLEPAALDGSGRNESSRKQDHDHDHDGDQNESKN